ncbi:efflux transporter outer membrane subunit [Haloferula sp. BvORR071]|uniref:efflux transporter outer membrane subunit n=1 Tax=Haloferula sp. BvORR071 TaxID=1396141 RepID=UPI00054EF167|nr:efflux transporter outer membrane subunit [Haloferula sp. BvORR071]
MTSPARRRLIAILAMGSTAFVAPSCTPTAPKAPSVTLPVSWRNAAGFPTASPDRDLSRWWGQFGDPQLTRLIGEALAGNKDLASAVSRVREAQARRDAQKASLYPTLDYSGARSTNARFDDWTRTSSGTAYSAGLSASWEPDFFGRNRQSIAAATANAEAAKEDLHSAQASLASEVALAYLDLRAAEGRLQVVKESVKTREETTQIASWRAQAGQIDALELRQAESSLESARTQLATLNQNIEQTRNRLSLLCGRVPGDVSTGAGSVPVPGRRLGVGIPADTIRQRPDVRAAGYAWVASIANTHAAELERLPSLRLSGNLGVDTLHSSKLFNPESAAAGLIAGISGPIFDGGRIRANITAQSAAEEQSLLAYERSILTALSEVEDALIACRQTELRLSTLEKAADAGREASKLATQRYRTGVIDFLTVLDAQRNTLAQEEALINARADRAAAHVQLYKALGGGWSSAS